MKKLRATLSNFSKSSILLSLGFLTGLMIFLYPVVTQIYSQFTQTRVIDTFQESLSSLSEQEIDEYKNQLTAYNESLAGEESTITDPFAETDDSSQPVSASGGVSSYNVFTEQLGAVIGQIDLPTINASLPIYEGTSEAILQKGIGWLDNTSFPIGGTGTHSVLTGHRGLPTSRLFTDLPNMEMGDVFYLHTLDETLAYEVSEILVVLPHETQHISVREDEDLVTLITCTPYMINTHRLLVTGVRIPYVEESTENSREERITPYSPSSHMSTLFFGLVVLILIALFVYKRRKESAS
ncbi:class C sortase [Alkalibacterium iburiense]|uniref:Class C sortase n=1 Tax=Alkalibacterium iburiense TaxID=290589 RepID=A0ABN0XP29_9LACT